MKKLIFTILALAFTAPALASNPKPLTTKQLDDKMFRLIMLSDYLDPNIKSHAQAKTLVEQVENNCKVDMSTGKLGVASSNKDCLGPFELAFGEVVRLVRDIKPDEIKADDVFYPRAQAPTAPPIARPRSESQGGLSPQRPIQGFSPEKGLTNSPLQSKKVSKVSSFFKRKG